MSKERKARRLALKKRLAKLEGLISSNSSHNLLEEYSKCKSDLESLYNYITVGIVQWPKSEWYEYGEKSSKYFLNFEKRKGSVIFIGRGIRYFFLDQKGGSKDFFKLKRGITYIF